MFTSQWQASPPWGWAGLCFNASRPTLQPPTWQPRFEVHHDASRHVFSCTSFWKEPQCALDSFPSTWSRGRAEFVNHIGAVFLLWHTTCMQTGNAKDFWQRAQILSEDILVQPSSLCAPPTQYMLCAHKGWWVRGKNRWSAILQIYGPPETWPEPNSPRHVLNASSPPPMVLSPWPQFLGHPLQIRMRAQISYL